MTHVTFFRNHERKYIGFKVEGHSNYAPIGQDIVCAGISMISQSTVYGIEEVIKAKTIKAIDPAKASIFLTVIDHEKQDHAGILIETMAGVIAGLSEQYSGHIDFETLDADVK